MSRGRHSKRTAFGTMLLQAAQELERQNPNRSRAAPYFHDFGKRASAPPVPGGIDWEEVARAAFDGFDVQPATDEMNVREITREVS